MSKGFKPPKRLGLDQRKLMLMRQTDARGASPFSESGNRKTVRRVPSLPVLKCLEKESSHGSAEDSSGSE
jgi:hypothetical protein